MGWLDRETIVEALTRVRSALAGARTASRAHLAIAALAAMLWAGGCAEETTDDDPSVPVTSGFPLYGPGAHWIDRVERGTVTFDAIAAVDVDLNMDGLGDLTLEVRGPTTVFRSGAQAVDAAQPGHRTHLDLEIIDMMLAADGVSFRAGDGVRNFSADTALFSIGRSDEIAGSPHLAHDHFEIYFEGEIAGIRLRNEQPLVMEATIDRLPPIDNVFTMVGPPLALLTEAGAPAGVQIISVEYTPRDASFGRPGPPALLPDPAVAGHALGLRLCLIP